MKTLILTLGLLTSLSANASTGNARSLSTDAVTIASILLNSDADGSAEVQNCVAKFRSLNIGITEIVELSGGYEEEEDVVYKIVGIPRSGRGKVVLEITTGEGSVSCKVE